jgi:membrane fusion protein (multidrug efflux system)
MALSSSSLDSMSLAARSRTARLSTLATCVRSQVAAAALALVIAGCGKDPAATADKGKGAGGPPPAIPVTVERVQPQRVPIALEAVGQAEGSREVEIRARVSGILEKRVFAEGASVRAGDVLFVIERAPYDIAAAQAKAALSQEHARQEQAQRESERLKTLAQNRAISQKEYDDAVSTLKQSTAAIEGAQAKLAEAQLNLSYTNLRAPISGITGRALRSEGTLVTANTDNALLTTMTQVNPIWVRFSVADVDFDRIRGAEKSARVKLLNQDDSVAAENGRLNFAGSTVDPKLGTVQLRAEFANPSVKWLPGQFVKVQILAGEQTAFLVPQAAVVQTEQARMVWIAEPDGKAVMRPIQTANWIGNNWVVTGGLKDGDAVIVDNLMKLRPGATVQAMAPGEAKPGVASTGNGKAAEPGSAK